MRSAGSGCAGAIPARLEQNAQTERAAVESGEAVLEPPLPRRRSCGTAVAAIVAVVPALRGLRVLRLLRLLRTVRVFRYGNPFTGLIAAFEADRLLFALGFALLGLQTLLGGISLYLVERGAEGAQVTSVGEGLWWALVTLTTVGYGDYAPVSDLGRVVGGTLMVGGMITLALFAGIVGHSLLNAVLSIREEQFRMSGYVDHVIVCGYERGSDLLLRHGMPQDFDAALVGLDQAHDDAQQSRLSAPTWAQKCVHVTDIKLNAHLFQDRLLAKSFFDLI